MVHAGNNGRRHRDMKANRQNRNISEDFSVSIGQITGRETVGKKTPTGEEPGAPAESATTVKTSIVMPEAVVASFAQVTLHRQTAGRAGRTVTMVTVKPPRPP
ncbi:MAG: hypothetical protein LBQ90_04765, partial [Synergistaceae bacterium]|nr:hypothetical protein [Synergistaceae bacterium]